MVKKLDNPREYVKFQHGRDQSGPRVAQVAERPANVAYYFLAVIFDKHSRQGWNRTHYNFRLRRRSAPAQIREGPARITREASASFSLVQKRSDILHSIFSNNHVSGRRSFTSYVSEAPNHLLNKLRMR